MGRRDDGFVMRWGAFAGALLLAAPSIALAQEDPAARLNSMIAAKLGSLEIAAAGLQVQLDIANQRVRELEKLCGDVCKPKAPEGK